MNSGNTIIHLLNTEQNDFDYLPHPDRSQWDELYWDVLDISLKVESPLNYQYADSQFSQHIQFEFFCVCIFCKIIIINNIYKMSWIISLNIISETVTSITVKLEK